jgi:MFS family permease
VPDATPYGAQIGAAPDWSDAERPIIPGSAAALDHSMPRRMAYFSVATLLGITAGLGNGLILANLAQVQGHLGLTPVQGQWLLAAYAVGNVPANLLLFKVRQQFGLRQFAMLALLVYALLTFTHLWITSFEMAVTVRLVSGLAAAAATALSLLYMLQAFGKARTAQGLVFGIALSQLATPLANVISPTLIDLGEATTPYLFESGLTLLCLGGATLLHLPQGRRERVFEPADSAMFALLATALGLLCAVFAEGRTQWWIDRPWIAFALIGAIALGSLGIVLERHRAHPLLALDWIRTPETLRLVLGAATIRLLLSEQSYGAIGLLRQLGAGPDQLERLYAIIFVASLAGIVTSTVLANRMLAPQILVAVAFVGIASLLDMNSTSQTRPHDMFFSQALVAAATGLFFGPLLMTTIAAAISRGPHVVISASVLFSVSQNLTGLAGPSLLSTYQLFREHDYSAGINADVDPTDPVVARRIASNARIYATTLTDTVLVAAEGAATLGTAATQEAQVRAYNDVFALLGVIAILQFLWPLYFIRRKSAGARSPAPVPASAKAT